MPPKTVALRALKGRLITRRLVGLEPRHAHPIKLRARISEPRTSPASDETAVRRSLNIAAKGGVLVAQRREPVAKRRDLGDPAGSGGGRVQIGCERSREAGRHLVVRWHGAMANACRTFSNSSGG